MRAKRYGGLNKMDIILLVPQMRFYYDRLVKIAENYDTLVLPIEPLSYVKMLEETPIFTYSKAEQQAYWINLYNALTVQVILDNYPVKSIKEAFGGVFKTGPWDKKLLTVEGKKVSLNDIEHTILRPIWKG